ncbi:hypothetical protein AB6A40_000909 [Gnathostoma spinigerum]|uniref:Methionine synthase reductase n=1 Tax=Gnathostoma spinigerum TaxID=75299 RepID=A0ABD6E409_9BILA
MSSRLTENDFLVVYGSQTGQSEAIANIIIDRSIQLGLSPRLHVLNESGRKFRIEEEPLVVIVCSSTGDGDLPDNAHLFLRGLAEHRKNPSFLGSTTFALLGLGDTNYTHFQGAPKQVERSLLELGAKKLIDRGEADEQVGLELGVEPWLDKLFNALIHWFELDISRTKRLFSVLSVSEMSKRSHGDSHSSEEEDEDIANETEEEDEEMSATDDEEVEDIPEKILKPAKVEWPESEACLIRGDQKIQEIDELQIPIPSQPYICSSVTHETFEDDGIEWQNGCKLFGAGSSIHKVRVVGTSELTYGTDGKPKREIQIDLGEQWESTNLHYMPGDAFYFIVANPREEVNFILKRVGLLTLADQKCHVVIDPKTEKKRAVVPAHVPPLSSLRYIFTYCLDIRRAPGRPLLRVFAENASDEKEKRRLLELCSSQGVDEFTKFIRQAGLSIADVFFAFPSAQPPVDRLIELLPRLMPRPYSVACSQKRWRRRVRFTYSMLNFPVGEGRAYPRHGLASDWLASLKVGDEIKIMLKAPSSFRFPPPLFSSLNVETLPLLMIGPGTGVAPFLSFLQEIATKFIQDGTKPKEKPERQLFFGCRNVELDYIYRDELEGFLREGFLTDLVVCESKPPSNYTSSRFSYVQDALKARGKEVADFVTRTTEDEMAPTFVFVCGDAKGMSKDVWAAFVEIIKEHTGKTEKEAENYMLDMKKKGRYIEDVWA